jgi:hypothetical protein
MRPQLLWQAVPTQIMNGKKFYGFQPRSLFKKVLAVSKAAQLFGSGNLVENKTT